MYSLNQSPSCRLLCPQERYEKEKDIKTINIHEEAFPCRVIRSSHLISDAEDEKSNYFHSLVLSNKKESYANCFGCRADIGDKDYYLCSYCGRKYHKECVESPSIFHSSDHPKHPLQLVFFSEGSCKDCFTCKRSVNLSYYCFICDFSLHSICARNPTPLTIDNRKRHEHTLQYFPRRESTLVCDVCALVDNSDYLYVCLTCDFIVHRRCVYLPYVIKVSRHDHRLAFIPNLSHKESTDCGICHAKINENYGEYYCMKRYVYALHSRCAMRNDVCDGKELEGEPEETYENNKMFEEIADGIIIHQSHQAHELSLNKNFHDDNKHCEACRLPFYDEGNVYQCMQYCDFILHESCAYVPRVKQSMVHVHPLILNLGKSWFQCRKCLHFSCGFAYVCPIKKCDCTLDTVCAFVCEPFDHYSHPHPLFVTCE
ncbi:unnamed protein product [Eruca vesicaria subsp. sativa]|uniref:DC1 domain-containing protein n=1 Tax=Eruca vesicaria subsp. sativa TaxID=29727 RepID=A0ABC8LSG3_ERUVS|nr:unnamed protein product [Eruca vesicaria subsp. sativa]